MSHHLTKTKILTSEDVQKIITCYGINVIMDQLIQEMKLGIAKFDTSKIQVPARSGFNYNIPNIGLVEWMPLYEIGRNVTIKVVGYHPSNPSKYNLPTILSSILQYDSSTGHLVGIADGVLLTALRTGAASAIATEYLAKENSSTLGLIGCGAQSITQVHAISRHFELKNILYYDIDSQTSSSFKYRIEPLEIGAQMSKCSIEEIVTSSDIICTATSIKTDAGPLFHGLKPKEGIHFNAVGSDFPGKVELPMDIIDEAFLCADFIDQALIEGECQRVNQERINTDISHLLRTPDAYEQFKNKTTVFDSTGWALEDHIVMNVFLDYADSLGIGQEIELEFIPDDAKNPYSFLAEEVFVKKQ